MPEYPSGGRIAFESDRDGDSEIYVMGCDGTNQVNLSNHSAEDKQPSWASGGRLAFSSNRNAVGGFDVYMLTLDPWGIARLTTNQADDESPALSTDGSKVAFVSYRDGNAEIYVLNISGNTLTRITNDTAADMDPAWSPDGSRLFFASYRDGDWDIYVAASDGSNVVNLTDSATDDSNDYNDRWPDFGFYDDGDGTGESIIAFASDRDGDWEIYSMFSDGTGQAQSTLNTDGVVDSQPSWDPLGEYVVIQSDRGGNFEVATMYYDAFEYINVTAKGYSASGGSNESSPDWEPVDDGAYCGE